ncbi:MAG: hypothetical protein ACR2FY_22380 [Pirellulaceae bacterium]
MSQKPCANSASAQPARKKLPREPTIAVRAEPRDTFQVVIHCASEAEQEQLYNEFRSRNFPVRLLTM